MRLITGAVPEFVNDNIIVAKRKQHLNGYEIEISVWMPMAAVKLDSTVPHWDCTA
jgi:hypothetical protein